MTNLVRRYEENIQRMEKWEPLFDGALCLAATYLLGKMFKKMTSKQSLVLGAANFVMLELFSYNSKMDPPKPIMKTKVVSAGIAATAILLSFQLVSKLYSKKGFEYPSRALPSSLLCYLGARVIVVVAIYFKQTYDLSLALPEIIQTIDGFELKENEKIVDLEHKHLPSFFFNTFFGTEIDVAIKRKRNGVLEDVSWYFYENPNVWKEQTADFRVKFKALVKAKACWAQNHPLHLTKEYITRERIETLYYNRFKEVLSTLVQNDGQLVDDLESLDQETKDALCLRVFHSYFVAISVEESGEGIKKLYALASEALQKQLDALTAFRKAKNKQTKVRKEKDSNAFYEVLEELKLRNFGILLLKDNVITDRKVQELEVRIKAIGLIDELEVAFIDYLHSIPIKNN